MGLDPVISHKSIKELVSDAHNYEYSELVPLKIYLRTADTLNRHGDLFKAAKSYNDAYTKYLRFLDLLLNKIPTHKQLKKDPVLYKTYLSLVNNKAPVAFQNAEDMRKRIEEENKAFERYATLKKQQQLEVEARKRKQLEIEQKKASIKALESLRPQISNEQDFNEEEFEAKLRQLHQGIEEVSPTLSYPSLHKAHDDISHLNHNHNTFEVDDPLSGSSIAPLLPPKKVLQEQPVLYEDATSSHPPPSIDELQQLQKPTAHKPQIEHKSIASNENGEPLKTVYIPSELERQFLEIAKPNTDRKLEFCGILCGKLSLNAFFVTTLLIPEQESTPNTCQTKDEETMFEYIDTNDLFVLGWIHTHPTQSCFLSSVDLHTQNSYQIMLPEAMAIVCAPRSKPNFGVFRLTDPPGIGIVTKCGRTGFHPHEESNIYKKCDKSYGGHVVIKNGLPFQYFDLRKKK